ncbi:MAG: hypothetical protein PHP48_01805 [Bacteroidales bacterium]|nr:hypothetical protein [Bacteroidales bacterium]MDD4085947.1 hypothetical protein [Bacteroidales bacterium]
MVKRILTISFWAISIAGVLLLAWLARQHYLNSPVNGLEIKIVREQQSGFLSREQLAEMVYSLTDSLKSKRIRDIRMADLENDLQQNPWIADADVSATLSGVLQLVVRERSAVLRAYNRKHQSLYVDSEGVIFPINPNFAARVPIVNGYLDFPALTHNTAHISDSAYRKSFLWPAFHLNEKLRKDKFLSSLIDQIYINSLGEIELSPKLGSASVLIGDLTNLEEKLLHLKAFYTQKGLSSDLADYRLVNLKYENQIVCTKR